MTLSSHYSTHRCKSQYYLCFLALLFAIISVIFAPFSAQAATANTQNFYFEDFTADYYLSRDADGVSHMRVEEQLTAVFPDSDQNHGPTRVIPFTNNDGKNVTTASTSHLDIEVLRNGAPEPVHDVTSGDGYFEVRIGDPNTFVHGRQTYTLKYEFENLILDQSNDEAAWQELYWDANGNDWSQLFNQATARVHLEDDLVKGFTGQTACYVGRYGESGSARCKVVDDGRTITFSARKLSAGESLTFVMAFAPDTFTIRPPAVNYLLLVVLGVFLAVTLTGIILTLYAFANVKAKRVYYKGLFVKPEYTAPRDFTVAEMAENYIGSGLKGNPKVATLLELAVNHKVELVKSEKTGVFGKKKTAWLVRVKSTKSLTAEQTKVLQILNGSDAGISTGQEIEIKTHTATSALQKLAQDYKKSTEQNLENKDLRMPKSAKSGIGSSALATFAVIYFILAIGAFLLAIILPEESYQSYAGAELVPFVVLPVGLVAFFILLACSSQIAKYEYHTDKGLEYSRYLEGLKLYISMAEADRLKFLQGVKGADTSHAGVVKLYERLLPYAVLFGLEKSWLSELSRYYEFDDVATPTWYAGMGVFAARDFTAAMNALTTTAGTSIAHSTTVSSSSSGSGFSGGFSGGGGGGGGGGGW